MKNAGMTICALLVLVSASWGTDKPAKKFHSAPSHPQHSLARTGEAGHSRSNGPSAVPGKSQSARQKEVEQLERQNATHLQTQSKQRSSRVAAQGPRIHPEPAKRGSNINFNYHPPRTQSTGTGNRKH